MRSGARAARDIRVVLSSQRPWARAGSTHATGFAFRGATPLPAVELAQVVDATPANHLDGLFAGLTGSFGVVKEAPDAVYAIADVIRGVPLFAVDAGGHHVITEDPLRAMPNLRAAGSDWRVRAELLKSSSVTAGDTLLDAVRQAEAGALLRVPMARTEPITARRYYAWRPNVDPDPRVDLAQAEDLHRGAIDRVVAAAGDALIAVPLSAGLDSGILAALLAKSAVDRDQVLTFTFGRPGNRESEVSRRVAASLGLRWEFVPYTDEMWHEVARSRWWPQYLAWASSLAGVPEFAEVPALGELRRRGVLPEGSVCMPGHTLGFVSGSFIPGALVRRSRGTRGAVLDAVFTQYYKYRTDEVIGALVDHPAQEVTDALRARAEAAVSPGDGALGREELVSLTEEFGWRERQAKMIVNGVRCYEHHQLRWALPWWDREVLDFWARVPLRQRVGQRLRRELAERVGWPLDARSALDSLQERVERRVRVLAVDDYAKKARNAARRRTRKDRYHQDELAALALVGEERFLRTYDGLQTPRAFLAEDVLAAIDGTAADPSDGH
jgi:asparagine synthase (glutamine-hydrolysing)